MVRAVVTRSRSLSPAAAPVAGQAEIISPARHSVYGLPLSWTCSKNGIPTAVGSGCNGMAVGPSRTDADLETEMDTDV